MAVAGSITCQVRPRSQASSVYAVRLATSLRCWFQSSPSPYLSLAMTIGRRPLERNNSASAVLMCGLSLGVPAAFPIVRERILLADEELGAFAIPIVIADEAARGEPAGALQAVEIVVEARLAAAGRAADCGRRRNVRPSQSMARSSCRRPRAGGSRRRGRSRRWRRPIRARPRQMARPPMPAQVMLPVPASPGT